MTEGDEKHKFDLYWPYSDEKHIFDLSWPYSDEKHIWFVLAL